MNDSGQNRTSSGQHNGELKADAIRPGIFHLREDRTGKQLEVNRKHTQTLTDADARVARGMSRLRQGFLTTVAV